MTRPSFFPRISEQLGAYSELYADGTAHQTRSVRIQARRGPEAVIGGWGERNREIWSHCEKRRERERERAGIGVYVCVRASLKVTPLSHLRGSASAVSYETSDYYPSLPELRPQYQQGLCREGRIVSKSSTFRYTEQLS